MAEPAQQNLFVVPPPPIFGYDFLHNIVYLVGSSVEFQWQTNYTGLILGLFQFGSVGSADVLINTTLSPAPTSLNWTAGSGYYTSNLSLPNVYYLTIWEGTNFTGAYFNSRYFNISFDGSTSTSTSTSPSTTFFSTATPLFTSTPSSTNEASSNSSTLKVGLGVGIGLGLPLFLLLGIILGWFMRKRQISPSQTEPQLQDQAWVAPLPEKLPVMVSQNPNSAAGGTDVRSTAELGGQGMAELAVGPRSR